MHHKEAKANVTPIRQRSQYDCMSASLAMCLRANGLSPEECTTGLVNKVMGARPMKGARWEEAMAAAQHYGMRATLTLPATVQQLKTWTDAGIPVMIAWNPEGREWSHASVVFDVDDQMNVHVADPNIPNPAETVRIVSEDEFYGKWYEKWPNYLVRRPAMAIECEITPEGRQVMAKVADDLPGLGQVNLKVGDDVEVYKTGLKGSFTVTKRIPKGTKAKVLSVNQGRNRNVMTLKSDKHGAFEVNEDWDMGKIRPVRRGRQASQAPTAIETLVAGYDGNPDGNDIYDNEIDHGYGQPLSGGTDVMKRLQDELLHEQGSSKREPNPRLARVDEKLMDRAAQLLWYMDLKDVVQHLVKEGVSKQDAYLAAKAGAHLNEKREKRQRNAHEEWQDWSLVPQQQMVQAPVAPQPMVMQPVQMVQAPVPQMVMVQQAVPQQMVAPVAQPQPAMAPPAAVPAMEQRGQPGRPGLVPPHRTPSIDPDEAGSFWFDDKQTAEVWRSNYYPNRSVMEPNEGGRFILVPPVQVGQWSMEGFQMVSPPPNPRVGSKKWEKKLRFRTPLFGIWETGTISIGDRDHSMYINLYTKENPIGDETYSIYLDNDFWEPDHYKEKWLEMVEEDLMKGRMPSEFKHFMGVKYTGRTASQEDHMSSPMDTLNKMARTAPQASDAMEGLAKMAAGDEKDAKFEKGTPADPTVNMTPEDKAKWEQSKEDNKDKFKSASPGCECGGDCGMCGLEKMSAGDIWPKGHTHEDAKNLLAWIQANTNLKGQLESDGSLMFDIRGGYITVDADRTVTVDQVGDSGDDAPIGTAKNFQQLKKLLSKVGSGDEKDSKFEEGSSPSDEEITKGMSPEQKAKWMANKGKVQEKKKAAQGKAREVWEVVWSKSRGEVTTAHKTYGPGQGETEIHAKHVIPMSETEYNQAVKGIKRKHGKSGPKVEKAAYDVFVKMKGAKKVASKVQEKKKAAGTVDLWAATHSLEGALVGVTENPSGSSHRYWNKAAGGDNVQVHRLAGVPVSVAERLIDFGTKAPQAFRDGKQAWQVASRFSQRGRSAGDLDGMWGDLVGAKVAARAPGGLYGFTRKTQSDVETSIRKLQRKASAIAKAAYKKDVKVATFLGVHAKRGKSPSARALVAALKAMGPKVASLYPSKGLLITNKQHPEWGQWEILRAAPGIDGMWEIRGERGKEQVVDDHELKRFWERANVWEKGASKEATSYGMYGYKSKTATLGLNACALMKGAAGTVSADLHRRRSAKHAKITAYLSMHGKKARCQYARMLNASYPDSAMRLAATKAPKTVDEWLSWDEE